MDLSVFRVKQPPNTISQVLTQARHSAMATFCPQSYQRNTNTKLLVILFSITESSFRVDAKTADFSDLFATVYRRFHQRVWG